MKKIILLAALALLSGCGGEPDNPPEQPAQGPHQYKVTGWVLGLRRGAGDGTVIVTPYYSRGAGSGGVYEELAACEFAGNMTQTSYEQQRFECIPYRVKKVTP